MKHTNSLLAAVVLSMVLSLASGTQVMAGGAGHNGQVEALTPGQWAETLKSLPEANAEAGKDVQEKRFCVSCHGVNGYPETDTWPKLAGQPANILVRSLLDYRDGRRQGDARADLMAAVVRTLTDQEIVDVAAMYESQTLKGTGEARAPIPDNIFTLVKKGDPDRTITPCAACHGVNAAGNPNGEVPVLYGQSRNYLELALRQYKAGTRSSDILEEMRYFAEQLTDEEIAGLADYFSSRSATE